MFDLSIVFKCTSFKLKEIKGGSHLFVYILDPYFSLVTSLPLSILLTTISLMNTFDITTIMYVSSSFWTLVLIIKNRERSYLMMLVVTTKKKMIAQGMAHGKAENIFTSF